MPEINGERLRRWVEVVKCKRRLIAIVSTMFAATAFLFDQQFSSLTPPLLLSGVILMLMISVVVFAFT